MHHLRSVQNSIRDSSVHQATSLTSETVIIIIVMVFLFLQDDLIIREPYTFTCYYFLLR